MSCPGPCGRAWPVVSPASTGRGACGAGAARRGTWAPREWAWKVGLDLGFGGKGMFGCRAGSSRHRGICV